jgi:hypothetical protein
MVKWLSRAQIVVGIWLIVSPWILGFYKFTPALWSSLVSGACVGLIGLWELFGRDGGEKDLHI